jgi:hypothetical protein
VDDPGPAFDAESARRVTNSIDGVVLAFDLSSLEALARGADCLIDLVPPGSATSWRPGIP